MNVTTSRRPDDKGGWSIAQSNCDVLRNETLDSARRKDVGGGIRMIRAAPCCLSP